MTIIDRPITGDTMDLIDGRIHLLTKPCDCVTAWEGAFPGQSYGFPWIDCTACKGSGKRGRGRCTKCAPDYPGQTSRVAGKVKDYKAPYATGACQTCNGELIVRTSITDTCPPWIVATIPVAMVWENRDQSSGESLVGMSPGYEDNTLYSCTDYGRTAKAIATKAVSWDDTVAALTVKIRADRTHVCKLITDRATMTLATSIIIRLTRGGYSVVATNIILP